MPYTTKVFRDLTTTTILTPSFLFFLSFLLPDLTFTLTVLTFCLFFLRLSGIPRFLLSFTCYTHTLLLPQLIVRLALQLRHSFIYYPFVFIFTDLFCSVLISSYTTLDIVLYCLRTRYHHSISITTAATLPFKRPRFESNCLRTHWIFPDLNRRSCGERSLCQHTRLYPPAHGTINRPHWHLHAS